MSTEATPSENLSIDTAQTLAMIEKGHQLAGQQPSSDALDRARRVLEGVTTPDEARAELDRKYPRG